jgi:hypothetical protein
MKTVMVMAASGDRELHFVAFFKRHASDMIGHRRRALLQPSLGFSAKF